MKLLFSLKISIFILFFGLTVSVLGIASVYSIRQITEIQVVMSSKMMQAVGGKISERVNLIYNRMESTLAAFERADGSTISPDFSRNPWLGTFINMMDMDKDIFSSYFGLSDGRFYQVISLKKLSRKGSRFNFEIPAEAAYAELRQVPDSTGTIRRYWAFYAQDRKKISEYYQESTDYDPTERIWYKSAYFTSERTISKPYVFYMINNYGITLSSRLKNGMDGVFGTDVTVSCLSTFLENQKITDNTRLVIYNSSGTVMGLSSPSEESENYKTGAVRELLNIHEINDVAIAAYTAQPSVRKTEEIMRFKAGGEKFIAKTIKVYKNSSETEYAAVIVPLRDLLGDIYALHYRIMLFVTLLSFCSIPLISYASSKISVPLENAVKKIGRIQSLDTKPEQIPSSTIKEINNLNQSLSLMAESIDRYFAFIPRDITSKIVSSGISTDIGGKKADVSIMYSHARTYGKISEATDAERFLRSISVYYSEIHTRCVSAGGTIFNADDGRSVSVWNSPLPSKDSELCSALAALSCSYIFNGSLHAFRTECGEKIPTFFGLHSGSVTAGSINRGDSAAFIITGESLQIAEAVCRLNEKYGTFVLATSETAEKLPDFVVSRWIGTAEIPGAVGSADIYELIGLRGEECPGTDCRRVSASVSSYYDRFKEIKNLIDSGEAAAACTLLEECLNIMPEDTAAMVMLSHIRS